MHTIHWVNYSSRTIGSVEPEIYKQTPYICPSTGRQGCTDDIECVVELAKCPSLDVTDVDMKLNRKQMQHQPNPAQTQKSSPA